MLACSEVQWAGCCTSISVGYAYSSCLLRGAGPAFMLVLVCTLVGMPNRVHGWQQLQAWNVAVHVLHA